MYNINELSIISNTDKVSIERLINNEVISSKNSYFDLEHVQIILLTKLLTKFHYDLTKDEYKQVKHNMKLYTNILEGYILNYQSQDIKNNKTKFLTYLDSLSERYFNQIIYDDVNFKYEKGEVVYNKIDFQTYESIFLSQSANGEIVSNGGRFVSVYYRGKIVDEEIALFYLITYAIENNYKLVADLERQVTRLDEANFDIYIRIMLKEELLYDLKYVASYNMHHSSDYMKLKSLVSLSNPSNVKKLFPSVFSIIKFEKKLEIINTLVKVDSIVFNEIRIIEFKYDEDFLQVKYLISENEQQHLVKLHFDHSEEFYTLEINRLINETEKKKNNFMQFLTNKFKKEDIPVYSNILDIIKNNIE